MGRGGPESVAGVGRGVQAQLFQPGQADGGEVGATHTVDFALDVAAIGRGEHAAIDAAALANADDGEARYADARESMTLLLAVADDTRAPASARANGV